MNRRQFLARVLGFLAAVPGLGLLVNAEAGELPSRECARPGCRAYRLRGSRFCRVHAPEGDYERVVIPSEFVNKSSVLIVEHDGKLVLRGGRVPGRDEAWEFDGTRWNAIKGRKDG